MGPLWSRTRVVFDWDIAMLIQPSRILPVMTATPADTCMRDMPRFLAKWDADWERRCQMSLKRTYEETVWV